MVGFGIFNTITKSAFKTFDFDLIIRDALVVDGSGKETYSADIGIVGKIIGAIGNLSEYKAARIINAQGLVVSPGFIDVHSHSDDELLVNPNAESKVHQGVTSEIVGQDGKSVAPLTPEMQSELNSQYLSSYGISVDWFNFTGYFDRLKKSGISVNLGSMLGQGTLRQFVIGEANRNATFSEIDKMKNLVRLSLNEGVVGISSGLEYTPGAFASSEELIEICKEMNFANGIYATHMRSEADYVVEGLDEAIAVAKGADIGLHVSHLKCMGKRNWSKLETIFDRIFEARRRGLSITFDRYPYTAYNTNLSSIFPVWAKSGTHSEFIQRLRNSENLPKLREETLAKVNMIGDWDAIMITSINGQKNKHLLGKRISEVANNGTDEFDFIRKLIIEENNGIDMCGFAMSEKNTAKVINHPRCMIASDASARAPYGTLNHSQPHPRTYGTFPKVLSKYVREQKLIPLPDAIRKMTGFPADRFGLLRRGYVKENYFADLVVFDLENIKDNATFTDPHQYPDGIHFVIVNGSIVVENNHHSGLKSGVILKKNNSNKVIDF